MFTDLKLPIKKEIILPVLAVAVVTFYSLFGQLGYSVFNGDQLIYFPSLLRSLDQSILPKDLMANFSPNSSLTFYDEIITKTVKLTGLDLFKTLFVLTILSRLVFFYALYRIGLYFTGNYKFSIFSLLIFVAGFKVYGTGMRTFADMFLARDVATALALMSLVFLFEEKWLLSSLFVGLGIFWQASMVIPYLLVFYLIAAQAVWRSKFGKIWPIIALFIPIFSVLFLLFKSNHTATISLFGTIDKAWLGILEQRARNYFVTSWYYPNSSPFYIIASIYFFKLLIKELPEVFEKVNRKKYFYLLFWIPAGLTIYSALAADLLRHAFSFQLHLSRSLLLWKVILNPLFVYYAYKYIKNNPRDILYNFSLLGILFSFVVSEGVMLAFLPLQMFLWLTKHSGIFKKNLPRYLSDKLIAALVFFVGIPILVFFAILHKTGNFLGVLPVILLLALACAFLIKYKTKFVYHAISIPLMISILIISSLVNRSGFSMLPSEMQNPKFMEACNWLGDHTSKDDIFLTEPFTSMGGYVRLICLRNEFVTKKDGGSSILSRDFAMEWRKRFDLALESEKDPKILSKIVSDYGVGYIFSDHKLVLNHPPVFSNEDYYIYKTK